MLDITLEELLEAGCHFGHQVRRWNPKMAPYIYGAREGVHIFDLAKTREGLLAAAEAAKQVASQGGTILFVGTKRQVKDIVQDSALRVNMPRVTTRWLGGTLTNFEQIRRSVDNFLEMKKAREAGEYKEYTKHEQLLIDKKIEEFERKFGGLVNLKKLPEMLFIVDTHEEHATVLEALQKDIPIVGLVDTNSDPTEVDWPIPANDDAVKSIALIVEFITKAIEKGKVAKVEKVERVEEA